MSNRWIYVVSYSDYDEHRNVRVFSSLARAKQFAARSNKKQKGKSGSYAVEGWPVS